MRIYNLFNNYYRLSSARGPPSIACTKPWGPKVFLIQVFLPKVSDVDFYAKTYRKPKVAVPGVQNSTRNVLKNGVTSSFQSFCSFGGFTLLFGVFSQVLPLLLGLSNSTKKNELLLFFRQHITICFVPEFVNLQLYVKTWSELVIFLVIFIYEISNKVLFKYF